jgi:hypothetical protein
MGYYKELKLSEELHKAVQEDEERQLRQEQYEEEAYQRLLIQEEFNFERDQGAKIP